MPKGKRQSKGNHRDLTVNNVGKAKGYTRVIFRGREERHETKQLYQKD